MDSFDFDPKQLLRNPLGERIYFQNLEPDWLLLMLDRELPVFWIVDGYHYMPGVVREELHGRYAKSAFIRFKVLITEVSTGREAWILAERNSYGEMLRDNCPTVIICEAAKEPRGWKVEIICYMDFAVETFHQLVRVLREAGGEGETVKPAGKKKRRRGGAWAIPLKKQKELVDEFRRLKASGRITSQDAFAQTKGISSRTLRNYLTAHPEKAETES